MRIFLASGNSLRGHGVANQLASLRHSRADDPRQRMAARRQRQHTIEQVGGEVAAPHVPKFMSQQCIDISGSQVLEKCRRHQQNVAAQSHGDGPCDHWRLGNDDLAICRAFHAVEDPPRSCDALGQVSLRNDGLRSAQNGMGYPEAPCQSRGEISNAAGIRDKNHGYKQRRHVERTRSGGFGRTQQNPDFAAMGACPRQQQRPCQSRTRLQVGNCTRAVKAASTRLPTQTRCSMCGPALRTSREAIHAANQMTGTCQRELSR